MKLRFAVIIMKCYDCEIVPDTIHRWDVKSKLHPEEFIFLCKKCLDKRLKEIEDKLYEFETEDPNY
jgi:hypothetical protein